MDGGHRYDEQWSMECSTCRDKYGVYTIFATRDGMTDARFVWIPRAALVELLGACDRITAIKLDFSNYLEMRHGEAWLAHFEGKAQKAVWQELTNDGREYPDLPAFYIRVRQSGRDRVLKDYLQYRSVKTVTRILQLNDAELSAQQMTISDLEQVHANKEMHILSREAFR